MASNQASGTRVSPAQAALNFAQMTRQNYQTLPAIAGAPSSTVTFNLPKVRLTSRVRVMVEAVLNVKHASQTSYTPAALAPYTMFRKVAIDMNNGFSPFNTSGKELYMYSLMSQDANILSPKTSGRGKVVQALGASASGVDNTVRFLLDLPLTLNDRDPIGLVLTQNQETTVTITLDIDKADTLVKDTAGFTLDLKNIVITPMVETFSVPALAEAFPDLSVLKLVMSTRQAISGSGPQTLKLPTGQTYRKFAMLIEDANGGVIDSDLTGDLEIVFNQADTPYRINAKTLAAINHEQYRMPLPQGIYTFDFSYQGVAGYSGSRDYIDTERLTEFWVKFNAKNAGNVTVVYETLTRLRSQ